MALVLVYPLYWLILLLSPISIAAQSHGNKYLGSFLIASNDESSWVSPSGDFAFGFIQIVNNGGFLLAIWFNKIRERTLVWSANRDEPVQRGSKVELKATGNLVLSDSTGKVIWSAEPEGVNEVYYAAMLDTGNFVLASRDSSNLWESFDHPTDTILPTQTINQGSVLIASFSETNYSQGRYMLSLERDSGLRLYTTSYPLHQTSGAFYWPESTSAPVLGDQLIFNQSGYIYLGNGSIQHEIFSNPTSAKDFYQRAVMGSDGVFRNYIYPKSSSSRWSMAWSNLSSIPPNICMTIASEATIGACGFNSYCTLGDDSRKICRCPPGYAFIDQADKMKGCQQNFVPQSCDKASEEVDLFEFREFSHMHFYGADYDRLDGVEEDFCRQSCLSDCFCAVINYRDKTCWKKSSPLPNGRIDYSIKEKAMIKVRKDNSTISASTGSENKENSILIYVLSGLLGCSVLLILLLIIATFVVFHLYNRRKLKIVQQQKDVLTINLQSFSYKELEEVTEGFKEELGRGAFGTVYKGVLTTTTNQRIAAVKKLNMTLREGEGEFKAEMRAIGRTNHKNLVQLLGFCNEGQHRLLVYEYMSNGSLADLLFANSRPTWYKRVQIAFGTARGLLYLHEECSNQIIHCDIKPQNILLDDSLTARISDFGLAKLLKVGQTHTTTLIRGTKGYVAPEWFKNLPITVKVDVYSFGILLLELVCCRRNFDLDAEQECQIILADWVYDCLKEGKLKLLVEKDEEAMEDLKRVEKLVMIGIWCIQEDPSLRPTMKKVAQMMEGTVEVSTPPDPTSFISSI